MCMFASVSLVNVFGLVAPPLSGSKSVSGNLRIAGNLSESEDGLVLLTSLSLPPSMSSPTSAKRVDTPDAQEHVSKKRRKGATRLSCAECRRYALSLHPAFHLLTIQRLKLRCDRSIPCGSCVKRGCGAICPDVRSQIPPLVFQPTHYLPQGSLTTGQGNRYIFHLHCYPNKFHPVSCLASSWPRHRNYTKRSRNSQIVSGNSKMPSAHHMVVSLPTSTPY